ncbi:MAG: glutamate--tRNA ligase [Verrucomicrobia bacterium]|nr:glutamate--tRNA ligase [Verrucomicrobiota bacterium]MCF7707787.1 glutamate--tRNA ligase [Verrucomicrobiota bacterium]
MSIRVRFAPSPTGFLHIGGARTALFNWLYARHTGGRFILRIEDTDAARNTVEAIRVILDGLKWLGMDWDEGPVTGDASEQGKGEYGPYYQSQRMDIYRRRVEELKARGYAYDSDGAVKFKMTREPVVFDDIVVGRVRRELTDREAASPDFVIVRSDGMPVFHLVNVIDDLEMGITHVIRGEDHLSNTSKHIALFRAFGVEPPEYAHIPLILNSNGSKMSKRDEGASLGTYMRENYVPEAVANFLCLLGWSPKDDSQLLTIDEVVERFDLAQILRHNARFDMKKLDWLNWEYMRRMSMERFTEFAQRELEEAGISLAGYPEEYIHEALKTCQEKIKTFSDLPEFADFYFKDRVEYDSETASKVLTTESRPILERVSEVFSGLGAFDSEAIQGAIKATAKELGVKTGAVVHPVRLACTGKKVGPSLYHLLEVLGKTRVAERIKAAIEYIGN